MADSAPDLGTLSTARSEALAQGHVKLFGLPVADDVPVRRHDTGADNVVSTAADLARLAVAVGLDGSGPRLLGPDSLARMRTPPDVDGDVYGMGWQLSAHRGRPVGGHDGDGTTFSSQVAVLPGQDRGYVLLMNSGHLLDTMIAGPQLREGMLELLTGHPAPRQGPAMRIVGLALLGLLVLSAATGTWALLALRHWRARVRRLSTGRTLRAIAPHVVVPLVMLFLFYELVPTLVGGQASNLSEVGRYRLPDVALLLVVSVVPDLVQAAYMTAVTVQVRRRDRVRLAALSRMATIPGQRRRRLPVAWRG
jgi:hypothetical protein